MITEIAQLLTDKPLVITLAKEGENTRLTVMPNGKLPALVACDTAANLDATLADSLKQYVTTVTPLANAVAEAAKEAERQKVKAEAEAKARTEKATAAAKKPATPAKPAPKPAAAKPQPKPPTPAPTSKPATVAATPSPSPAPATPAASSSAPVATVEKPKLSKDEEALLDLFPGV